jgi:sugar lactone lactonase YvrE
MDNNGYLYVTDSEKHEVRRWKVGENRGTLVAGGNEQGNRLNQLNYPADIVVDDDRSLYVLDCGNHRVMKWIEGAQEGIVIAGGKQDSIQWSSPNGLVVDHSGNIYVADRSNHRIMCWCKGATQWDIVVSGDEGKSWQNQIYSPTGLSVNQGNLYAVEYYGHRVLRFDIDQSWDEFVFSFIGLLIK